MNQHIVITGASSGIGAALARELGRAGAKLTLIARRRELLDQLAKEIGPTCLVIAHDLADPDHLFDWIAGAEAEHGPIDIMVNNAGMENTGATARADVEQAKKLFQLNLLTPILITRHDDQPGVVGLLGTVLGSHRVNIRRIELGPATSMTPGGRGLATGVLSLYEEPSQPVLAHLRSLEPVREVRLVRL